jgi:hypothetical protein
VPSSPTTITTVRSVASLEMNLSFGEPRAQKAPWPEITENGVRIRIHRSSQIE